MMSNDQLAHLSLKALDEWARTLEVPISEAIIEELQNDQRAGAQRLAKRLSNQNARWQEEQSMIQKLQEPEEMLHQSGYHWIAGTDEVGRGPLAGPVVVCAIVFPEKLPHIYLNDSKQLSHARRQDIVAAIEAEAEDISIQVIDNEIIDKINILEASRLGMTRAVQALHPTPDYVITDAVHLPQITIPQSNPIKGDATCYSVAAASIYAKEYRDRLMCEYAKEYPEYHFDQNAGYPTKEHLTAIERYGITPIHRRSFAPVKKILDRH